MTSKVSQYYQSIINKFSTNYENDNFQEYAQLGNLTTGFGTIVLNINKKGFYGIIDDNNQQFLPINSDRIQHLLRDRKRVQFSLQEYPEVSNIYRWGISVKIIAIQVID